MSLTNAMREQSRVHVALYGTTPPRADAPQERLKKAATRLGERLAGAEIDGMVIYDVQEERGRTSEPRPFPFLPTYDPRVYGREIASVLKTPTIAYKCVAQISEPEFEMWLDETQSDFGINCVSLVGRATSAGEHAGTPLLRAVEIAARRPDMVVGGVVIPERHTRERSESARLLQKIEAGCSYFISQAVYSPNAAIGLCRDYARDCTEAGVSPRRIIFTFTPCGRAETLGFMRWLGVTVPLETEAAILGATDPLGTSIDVCAENLRRILDSGIADSVPIGINVESVSIHKTEIAGSVELLNRLGTILGGSD